MSDWHTISRGPWYRHAWWWKCGRFLLALPGALLVTAVGAILHWLGRAE